MSELNHSIWGFTIPDSWLDSEELIYLMRMPKSQPTVEWVWGEMDRVWQELGLNNKKDISKQPIDKFYGHPVWTMNGIFTALDPVSSQHRKSIARYIATLDAYSIADYGGGFGELAIAITNTIPNSEVSIIEPYPSRVTTERLREYGRVHITPELTDSKFDVVIAQDVLEHVTNPIKLAYNLAEAVNDDGIVIFANCFRPVIHCHLPSTFHLRYTFTIIMKVLGLKYLGTVDGAEHAQIFIKKGSLYLDRAVLAEDISKVFGSWINRTRELISYIRRTVMR